MDLKKETRVLITGSGGMLGDAVYRRFSKECKVIATDIDVNEPWITKLDVTKLGDCARLFSKYKPDVVLHLAALTDLEYCQKNPREAYMTNTLGTENIALLSRKHNSIAVYIGSAGIFDGKKEYYSDYDVPNPLSEYGKSKYYGEQLMPQILDRYYIFRAGWMMGGGIKKDKKFINKVYRQIKNGSNVIYAVDDKVGTPTYTYNFADAMFRVIQTELYGLYNMVCHGDCSRLDVAKELVNLLNKQDEIKVKKVKSDYFKKEYFAPRPYSEKLVNLKLQARNMDFMRHWKDCLKEYSTVFASDLHGKI